MTSSIRIRSIAAVAAALALGCGGSEEPTPAAPPAAAGSSATGEVIVPATDEAPPSPVDLCKTLAAEESWDAALEPCMRAAIAAPSDLAVRHALQQAEAAAEEGS